jgi:cadmium resistance protein CadD (predicted permease)
LLALAFPAGWVALLGIVPLLLGFGKLLELFKNKGGEAAGSGAAQLDGQEQKAEQGLHSQMLAVASVTVANGGDNIGVYVPLFASDPGAIANYAFIFAVMTGIWCALGYLLVNNKLLGGAIRRYGHLVLPFVLIALGVHILSGSLTLLH